MNLTADEKEFLELVNVKRQEKGLHPLEVKPELMKAAKIKCEDMIRYSYCEHFSPRLGRIGKILRGLGYKFHLAAENIGIGSNIHILFSAFLSSSGHRNKILGHRYYFTGVSIIPKRGGIRIAQVFSDV